VLLLTWYSTCEVRSVVQLGESTRLWNGGLILFIFFWDFLLTPMHGISHSAALREYIRGCARPEMCFFVAISPLPIKTPGLFAGTSLWHQQDIQKKTAFAPCPFTVHILSPASDNNDKRLLCMIRSLACSLWRNTNDTIMVRWPGPS
jgi:hypothetical protein